MSDIRRPDVVHYEEPIDADVALTATYAAWPDKGEVVDGRRMTIMSERVDYVRNEPVRVVHVAEAVEPGLDVYVMGPKVVHGEELDGELMTSKTPPDEEPFVPNNYDGVTLESPAVDTNYLVTTYSLSAGRHEICWRLDKISSNTLSIGIS